MTAKSGERLAALFAPAPKTVGTGEKTPTILFFYGNDMSLQVAVPAFQLLQQLGVNVMIPEYVGYGMSSGKPSEHGCYATADAAYHFLVNRAEVDPNRIIVAGCSLGGAVAIDLAARRRVAGLATLVTFTSLKEMASLFFPPFLVRLVLKYRFNNERKIRKISCPTLIGHSTGDKLIPMEMADRLAAAAGGPVSRLTIDGADHNSTSVLAKASDKILQAFHDFVRACDHAAVQ